MKETFDKIVLNEDRKDQMRENILAQKRAKKTWIAPVIGIAASIAIVMLVPFTRTAVVNAAGKLWEAFTSNHNRLSISLSETEVVNDEGEEVNAVDFRIEQSENTVDFAQVKDGRLYLVLDGKWTDVTDKCSDSKYYRHEIKEKGGAKAVILVGGTPEDYGWCYLFSHDGAKVTSCNLQLSGKENKRPAWFVKGLKDEGMADAAEDMPSGMGVIIGDDPHMPGVVTIDGKGDKD